MNSERLALTAIQDTRGTWRVTLPKWLIVRLQNVQNIPSDRRKIPVMVEVEL